MKEWEKTFLNTEAPLTELRDSLVSLEIEVALDKSILQDKQIILKALKNRFTTQLKNFAYSTKGIAGL